MGKTFRKTADTQGYFDDDFKSKKHKKSYNKPRHKEIKGVDKRSLEYHETKNLDPEWQKMDGVDDEYAYEEYKNEI